jgi:abortive infection bacteriophage resistance protein
MESMKNATTVEEQIQLYKDRGCILDIDEKRIKQILMNVGCFRLGFYAFPFEETYPQKENRTHILKKGTKFSDIYFLYNFDFDLRMALLKYLNYIEINFKTKLIYFVSNHYKDNPTWFISPPIMSKQYIDNFDAEIYNRIKENQKTIKHHHQENLNDKYAPAWKTFEYATFGNLLATFKSLSNNDLKIMIAKSYNINGNNNKDIFTNYIQSVKKIRDVSAHNGILYDYLLDRALINGPALKIDSSNRNKLYSIILVMRYLLKSISIDLSEDMEKDIDNVFNAMKDNENLKSKIEICSGYSYKK